MKRRHLLQAPAALLPAASASALEPRARGVEGQRRADLGDGRFLNPIVSGNRPDPTVLKDGADYYMTFSSFNDVPGAVIWHSRDLVNWAPIAAALRQPLGTVWAMDLVKHGGRYFLYIPVLQPQGIGVFVVWADDIRGPWSEPVDLKLPGCIDPGHVVGEDGRRYLFVNGIRRVRLTDDGLATDGELVHAYTPWQYPKDWVVEMFAPEGPKLLRRGGWFYLVTAVGGTSGPATSHMVISARSRSVLGPWEHCPANPLVRTRSEREPWWSRGHATLVEGPAGDWWMVYHGYENGYRTLGRQVLLEPIEWTADGWFRARGGDLSRPMKKPAGGRPGPLAPALSDDFREDRLGTQWTLFNARPGELQSRLRREGGALELAGRSDTAASSSPLTMHAGDRAYEITATLELLGEGDGEGGLLLFYSERMYVGLGFSATQMRSYHYGEEQTWMRAERIPGVVHVRLRNHHHDLTWWTSADGREWAQHPWQMEVSGMHHNVFGGFLSLRPAFFCSGSARLRITRFGYRALGPRAA